MFWSMGTSIPEFTTLLQPPCYPSMAILNTSAESVYPALELCDLFIKTSPTPSPGAGQTGNQQNTLVITMAVCITSVIQ